MKVLVDMGDSPSEIGGNNPFPLCEKKGGELSEIVNGGGKENHEGL